VDTHVARMASGFKPNRESAFPSEKCQIRRIDNDKRPPGRVRGAADWQLENRAQASSAGEVGRRATWVLCAARAISKPEPMISDPSDNMGRSGLSCQTR